MPEDYELLREILAQARAAKVKQGQSSPLKQQFSYLNQPTQLPYDTAPSGYGYTYQPPRSFDPSKLPKWQPEEEPLHGFKAKFRECMELYGAPEHKQVTWLVTFCLPITVADAVRSKITNDIEQMWQHISNFYYRGSQDDFLIQKIRQLEISRPHKLTSQNFERFVNSACHLFSQLIDASKRLEAMNLIARNLPPVIGMALTSHLNNAGSLSSENFQNQLRGYLDVFKKNITMMDHSTPAYSAYENIWQPPRDFFSNKPNQQRNFNQRNKLRNASKPTDNKDEKGKTPAERKTYCSGRNRPRKAALASLREVAMREELSVPIGVTKDSHKFGTKVSLQ